MRSIFAAVLLFAAPSFAEPASRPASSDEQRGNAMEGLYAAMGGGGALIILDAGNAFGYDFEGRLGYSFGPGLQIYVSGAIDGATIAGNGFRSEIFALFAQYHLYAWPSVGIFARVGAGAGISNSTPFVTGTALGFAWAAGLGVEIGLSPNFFITPECFYKNAYLNSSNGGGSITEQVAGLQLAFTFY